ncbi:DUF7146 domain-containing protein [Aquibium microcysteis]|uniref:DUF7146 domain-containing protein n=1 Tax=Aquibium microcysteis TaxID=675281 RepID=UPI00165D03B8|nr:toprim domain-containing protein [Aquibium microcysteis]
MTAVRNDLSYKDILDQLNDRAEEIAAACIPDGKKNGNYWRGDLNGKISVHIRGGRVGMVGFWQGQGGNDKGGGNLIHLIELAFGCETHGAAVKLAKERFLGIRKRELTEEEKRAWAKQQEESRRRAEQRERDESQAQERKVETVRSIWQEAKPIAGTAAETYLRSRSIDMPQWPVSLRFHPSVAISPETPRSPRHMALVGGVQAVDRRLVALWRIFLEPDGKPVLDESGKKVKLGFGPAAGGAVRFGPVTETLRLTEGMETALGVMLLTKPGASVWATLSTSGMIGFQIPPGVRRIEIYADGDRHRENKRTGGVLLPPGIAAAEKLKAKAEEAGVQAVVFPSPEPDDWLDVWQAKFKDETRLRNVQYL